MNERGAKRILPLVIFAAAIAALFFVSREKETVSAFLKAVSPLYLGLFLAFVLNIPYKLLERLLSRLIPSKRAARVIAVVLTYILFVGVIVLFLTVLLPQLSKSIGTLYDGMPEYLDRLEQLYERIAARLGIERSLAELMERYGSGLMQMASELTKTTGTAVLNLGISLGTALFRFLLAVIVSIYVLCAKQKLKDASLAVIRRLFPAKKAERVRRFFVISSMRISSFIGGQVIDALLLGLLCFLGMIIIGLPFATLIGMIIAVTALVPIIGAWVGGALSALIIAMENPIQALIFVIFLITLQQLENNLLYPKIVGDALGISGLWVLVGVTLGGALFGVWGMLLGAPVCSIIKHYIDEWVKNAPDNI